MFTTHITSHVAMVHSTVHGNMHTLNTCTRTDLDAKAPCMATCTCPKLDGNPAAAAAHVLLYSSADAGTTQHMQQ